MQWLSHAMLQLSRSCPCDQPGVFLVACFMFCFCFTVYSLRLLHLRMRVLTKQKPVQTSLVRLRPAQTGLKVTRPAPRRGRNRLKKRMKRKRFCPVFGLFGRPFKVIQLFLHLLFCESFNRRKERKLADKIRRAMITGAGCMKHCQVPRLASHLLRSLVICFSLGDAHIRTPPHAKRRKGCGAW